MAVGLMLNLSAERPSVIMTNTPIRLPLGAISKTVFLFGSDRSTLATNMAGVPLKMPSVSKVMLYQFTRPVELPNEFAAGIVGVELFGSISLITVFKSKKTLLLPVAGSTR